LATAEAAGLPVLHYDEDFERIAEVTGQPTEWIDISDRPARVHAFTVCHFGSEEFLPETPFVLALCPL